MGKRGTKKEPGQTPAAESSPREDLTAGDSNGGATPDVAEIDNESLQAKVEENWNKYLRVAADLENLRKRAARDEESARRRGLEQLAQALLPVRDSLEAGVATSEQADVEALLDGKRATLRLLDSALTAVGISELDPIGEPFDPEEHEAITLQPSDEVEVNTILEVIQKGYQLHGRLLRPARVIVAGEPPVQHSEEVSEEDD
ncbi:MAG: nucleotide exchange factor GrpE [Pseudomonadota bacterium]|nr:nucleotide exchange factor GrpE [Pseudomonadota bacterium]